MNPCQKRLIRGDIPLSDLFKRQKLHQAVIGVSARGSALLPLLLSHKGRERGQVSRLLLFLLQMGALELRYRHLGVQDHIRLERIAECKRAGKAFPERLVIRLVRPLPEQLLKAVPARKLGPDLARKLPGRLFLADRNPHRGGGRPHAHQDPVQIWPGQRQHRAGDAALLRRKMVPFLQAVRQSFYGRGEDQLFLRARHGHIEHPELLSQGVQLHAALHHVFLKRRPL